MSLSTFPFPRLVQTWQRLLDAVVDLPVRVTATTGHALDSETLRAPPHVRLLAWSDRAELMPDASVVVTHGGHGTTLAALAHGVPVLVVPLDLSSDQPGIGRAVERAGVGISLRRGASVAAVRAALSKLIDDTETRRRARELGARLREYDGAVAGAEALIAALPPTHRATEPSAPG
ncbi:glycosyltransferase [Leucobacter aridicollis]|uniref:UDP:flavonoid glycosyltransferase YjiC (YdhE family) n=1 Tax=Leucobacter aridicollis TaxID=283878 RepID=A0A852R8D5_9MICO|nr:nucleotide disphospho-sugar-binding domain-containing protein [Leucobacter aridicollis]NYD27665.1 UDP:flavonoid glycosyltransferase YjiC (YdhE family) [Leucobacter aridicollis]